MSLKAPAWHSLLEGIPELSTTSARSDLSSTVRLVEQNGGRCIFTTYAQPRACIVSLSDAALLQILDQQPELLAEVKKFVPK